MPPRRTRNQELEANRRLRRGGSGRIGTPSRLNANNPTGQPRIPGRIGTAQGNAIRNAIFDANQQVRGGTPTRAGAPISTTGRGGAKSAEAAIKGLSKLFPGDSKLGDILGATAAGFSGFNVTVEKNPFGGPIHRSRDDTVVKPIGFGRFVVVSGKKGARSTGLGLRTTAARPVQAARARARRRRRRPRIRR